MKQRTHVPENIVAEWYSPDQHWKVQIVEREHLPWQLPLIAVQAWEGGDILDSQSTYNNPSARLKFETMKKSIVNLIAIRAFGVLDEGV